MKLRERKAKVVVETGDTDDDGEDFQHPKKRAKKSTRNPSKGSTVATTSRRKGRLRELTEFPLDLLLEVRWRDCYGYIYSMFLTSRPQIFQHLDPLDLLRLARTTKALRSILMSKISSLRVWQESLDRTGIPPKPDDLSEPAYANLAFSKHCHVRALLITV